MRKNWMAGAFALGASAALAGVVAGRAGADGTAYFSGADVAAGARAYAANCAACHGAALANGGAPALRGKAFTAQWSGKSLQTFYGYVKSNMPLGKANSLPAQTYADVVAYVLSRNGIAAGDQRLTPSSSMARALVFPGVAVAAAGATPKPVKLDVLLGALAQPTTSGPTQAELDGADASTASWLAYDKGYRAERYSALAQIDVANAAKLHRVCARPLGVTGTFSGGLVEYAGTIYATTHLDTYAFDATTCALRWHDHHVAVGPEMNATNKGVALAGGRVIRGTQDGFLFALDAKTGKPLWKRQIADWRIGAGVGAAPIVWHGLVFVGKAGGDWGIHGEMMAFHVRDGSPAWTFDLIPDAGQRGAKTWRPGSSREHGGGASWTTYALDERTGTLFVPVGNPGPDFVRSVRGGRNLYSNSIVALDAATGKLKWAAQQRPYDFHDYDTTSVGLFDAGGVGYVSAADKGGELYVYRRDTGAHVFTLPMTTLRNQSAPITAAGTHFCPVAGVQWNGAAHDPKTGLLYVNAIDWCSTFKAGSGHPAWIPTVPYTGLANGFGTNDPVSTWSGWIDAVDPRTGKMAWRDHVATPMYAAITPTAGDVLFTGDLRGTFLALDARNGKTLYRDATHAGPLAGGVITYERGGKQYVAAAAGNSGGSIPLTGTPTLEIYAL